jgi:hypothetical protein
MAIPKALLWTMVGVVVVGGLVSYLGCKALGRAFLGDVDALAAALPAELEAARREGLPTDPVALFPGRPVPDSKNAAAVIAGESAAVNKRLPSSHAAILAMANLAKGTASWQDEGNIREAIKPLKPSLDRIVAASKKPFCDFGKDYSLGAYVLFPEFAQIKTVVKVLGGRAHLAAQGGRLAEAEASLTAAFKLSQFAGQEPCLIGSLVQIACAAITQRTLRKIIFEQGKDARVLAMANRLSGNSIRPVDMRRAFKGELVMGLATIRTLKGLKEVEMLSSGAPSEETSPPMEFIAGHMRSAWQTRYVQFWRRVFSRLPKDPKDFLALRKVMIEETAAEEKHTSLDYMMNKILLPVFDQAALACCKERSDLALTRAVVDLFKYRVRRGTFPDRLGELPRKYVDAFDNKPLRYRKTAAGFLIYSIDRDLRDDGGMKLQPGGPTDGPRDFVVEYP